jgi:hypothetical protein
MDRNFGRRGRDPRSVDLAVIVALLALVVAASAVLSDTWEKSTSPTAIHTTVWW